MCIYQCLISNMWKKHTTIIPSEKGKKNPPQTPKPYHQNQPVLNHTSVWRTILKKSQENFDVQLNNCYLPDILHHYNFLKKTWKILNKCLDLGCYKD